MVNVRTVVVMACGLGAGIGCGSSAPPGVDPNTAYSIASDIEAKAKVAETSLDACKEDKNQCEAVASNLRSIQDQSSSLQQTAVAAGAKSP
ncbi:MAG TPA: hypothetical protein VNN72_07445 [Polyangiaceae bacterium]|nr:hypothetical protein [Polyangiaceae bacterium]